MNYKAIHIVFKKQEEADIISALLSDFPFEGFEEKKERIIGYIPASSMPSDKELKAVLKDFAYQIEEIEDQNWNKLWESNYSFVQLGTFCGIRADFHPHFEGVKYELTINPRMSFGTGHHATTKLMLEMMKAIDFKETKVLDFGTGTGVLAILADKMGAEKVCAVEHDPNAVENAKENIKDNNTAAVEVYCRNSPVFLTDEFDIVMANITKNIILENAVGLWDKLKVGGTLILSGLLEKDVNKVIETFVEKGGELKQKLQEEEWRGIEFQRIRQ